MYLFPVLRCRVTMACQQGGNILSLGSECCKEEQNQREIFKRPSLLAWYSSTEVLRVLNHQVVPFLQKKYLSKQRIFFGFSREKWPVLKRAWQGLSDNWGTQWVKSWGHAEKVMFSSHDFFSMTPWLYPLCTPIIWKHLRCSFQNRSYFHSSYNQKKVPRIEKQIFLHF